MKQVSANAQSAATEDQASDISGQKRRDPFELNVTEEPPTTEQMQTILEYVGPNIVSKIVKGAHDHKDALKKFKQSQESFQWPVVGSMSCSLWRRRLRLTMAVDGGLEQWQGYCWRQRVRNSPASEQAEVKTLAHRRCDDL